MEAPNNLNIPNDVFRDLSDEEFQDMLAYNSASLSDEALAVLIDARIDAISGEMETQDE